MVIVFDKQDREVRVIFFRDIYSIDKRVEYLEDGESTRS